MPRPAAVYSSTLRRARETAAAYAELARVEVVELEDLGEWYGGAWENKSFEEIFRDHPEAKDLFLNQDPAWHLAPGSESAADFQRRAVDTVEKILAEHPEGDVFVVAHGGVINAYLARVLELHDREMFFLPENTSLNTVVVRGDERRAWFLSDAVHLTEPGWFE